MGGSLEPEDTPGGGLTMAISLPATPAPAAPPALSPGGEPPDAVDGQAAGDGRAEIPSAATAAGTRDPE
jgi:two-component system sensor histidine kinase KdpD